MVAITCRWNWIAKPELGSCVWIRNRLGYGCGRDGALDQRHAAVSRLSRSCLTDASPPMSWNLARLRPPAPLSEGRPIAGRVLPRAGVAMTSRDARGDVPACRDAGCSLFPLGDLARDLVQEAPGRFVARLQAEDRE
jgi:hypothetical protein